MGAPVTFAVEALATAYGEASALLLDEHWQEVALYRDLLTVNPDIELYEGLERAGKLFIVTARARGQMVGYVMMLIHPHPHYKHVIVATDDIHFLHRDFRKGFTGCRLIDAAETEAARRGAQIIAWRTKVGHDHGALFARRGYTAQDVVYTKRLDGEKAWAS